MTTDLQKARDLSSGGEKPELKVIYIRCDPDTHAQIEIAAVACGMSINEFCKFHLLAVASKVLREKP